MNINITNSVLSNDKLNISNEENFTVRNRLVIDAGGRVDADASIKMVINKPRKKEFIENFSMTAVNTGIYHRGTRSFINKRMFALSVILVLILIGFILNILINVGEVQMIMDYQIFNSNNLNMKL
jgi:hypothetical protein